MKEKTFFTFLVLFVLSLLALPFVFAAGEACSGNTDCSSGEVCDGGVCVAFCPLTKTECSDGIDNDGDGAADFFGACDDNNDGVADGACDYSSTDKDVACDAVCLDDRVAADAECRSPLDTSEASDPECADGVDNDADGAVDYPFDSYCSGPEGAESSELPACSDGEDNDADGMVDFTGGCDTTGDGVVDYVCGCYDEASSTFTSYGNDLVCTGTDVSACDVGGRLLGVCGSGGDVEGTYYQADSSCGSLDGDDESGAVSAAPEFEQSIWDRFWNWFFFWK